MWREILSTGGRHGEGRGVGQADWGGLIDGIVVEIRVVAAGEDEMENTGVWVANEDHRFGNGRCAYHMYRVAQFSGGMRLGLG